MNTIGYFEIQASEPEKLVGFYKNIFDWDFVKVEGMPIAYYRQTEFSSTGVLGAILQRPAAVPAPQSGTNAFVCSVHVEDFDTTCDAILKNGGQIALPKFAVPGRCWQGYFIDTDGNTFGIYEVDEHAK